MLRIAHPFVPEEWEDQRRPLLISPESFQRFLDLKTWQLRPNVSLINLIYHELRQVPLYFFIELKVLYYFDSLFYS